METPEAAGARVPPEVSLEPLVTVVAILGELGATAGDVPLAGPVGSLRAGLVAFVAKARQAMGHRASEATRLRHALATVEATTATSAATPEPTAVPPGDSVVPRATVRDTWATVATIARCWREAVATVEVTWAALARDIADLRDACDTAATTGATGGVTMGHLAAAVATEDKARRELLATARALPVASELATVAEAVTSHRTRVAEASAGLKAATEATEATAVAAVGAAVASERSRRAAVAREPLGRLVAACDGATRFYRHLCCHLKDMEATVAALAAGCGGPEAHGVAQGGPGVPKATATMEDGPGVPKATVTTQVGPGVPKDLMAAVTVAEALWDASARLAKCHLLEALKVARELLTTPGVPSVTAVTSVATRCGAATAALAGLLPRGPR